MHTCISYTLFALSSEIVYDNIKRILHQLNRQREYCSFSAGDRGLRKTLLDNELCGWNAKDVTRSTRRFALKMSDPRLADSSDSR